MFVSSTISYFAEAILFCVVMLSIFVVSIFRGTDKQESRILLAYTIITLAGGNLVCIPWLLLEHARFFSYIDALTYLTFFGWSVFTLCTASLWFLYSEALQQNERLLSRRNRIIAMVPAILTIILVFATPSNGWFLKVNASRANVYNVYHFGPLLPLLYIVAIGYTALTAIKSLVKGLRQTNPGERKALLLTAFYPIIPVVTGVLQITIFRSIPIYCFGCVAAVLITFISSQSGRISNDPLTHLNNRNELNNYASHAIKDKEINGDLWLILFDLDKFKPINDIYGHVEGDHALVKMADILRMSCKSSQMHRNFIARFGGDEFIIITSAAAERDRIISEVKRLMREENETSGKPYELLCSVGYSKYESSLGGVAGWLKQADEMMYAEKEEKKKTGAA